MTRGSLLILQGPLALGWGLLATAALLFTRFDGGVAFLWGATALLIVALIRSPRRHWWAPLAACGVMSLVATTLFGLGWAAALPFAVINLAEAVIAARVMRFRKGGREVMAGLSWFGRFLVAMTLAPVAVAPLVGATLWMLDGNGVEAMFRFIVGHALGNLTIVPIAFLMTGRNARRETVRILSRKRCDAALLLPFALVVNFSVFWQETLPLLFLPVIGVVLATFRLGRVGAALSLVMVAVIGGILTGLGRGPMMLMDFSPAGRMLFFQAYLACTVLTSLPIAADLYWRQKLMRALRRRESEFRMIAEHCSDVIVRMGSDGRVRYVSPSIFPLTGYRPEQLIGERTHFLIEPGDHLHVIAEQQQCLAEPGMARSYQYRIRTCSGEVRWLESRASAIPRDSGKCELLAVVRDITAAKAREAELTEAALRDRLTGLPNRHALEVRVARRQRKTPPDKAALALLDLDHFKDINDRYGHDAGDAVLRGFAALAQRMVRGGDTVVRLGGEEFVILFEHSCPDQAYAVCERLRAALGRTLIPTPAGPIRVTVSGGVAILDEHGLEAALKAADQALYQAKREGRDRLLLAA